MVKNFKKLFRSISRQIRKFQATLVFPFFDQISVFSIPQKATFWHSEMITPYFQTIFSPFQAISSNFGFSIFWPNLCGLDPPKSHILTFGNDHTVFSINFLTISGNFQQLIFFSHFLKKKNSNTTSYKCTVPRPSAGSWSTFFSLKKSLFDIRKWSHRHCAIPISHSTHYQTLTYLSSV